MQIGVVTKMSEKSTTKCGRYKKMYTPLYVPLLKTGSDASTWVAHGDALPRALSVAFLEQCSRNVPRATSGPCSSWPRRKRAWTPQRRMLRAAADWLLA